MLVLKAVKPLTDQSHFRLIGLSFFVTTQNHGEETCDESSDDWANYIFKFKVHSLIQLFHRCEVYCLVTNCAR